MTRLHHARKALAPACLFLLMAALLLGSWPAFVALLGFMSDRLHR